MLTESHKMKFITKARKYENTKKKRRSVVFNYVVSWVKYYYQMSRLKTKRNMLLPRLPSE
jgi:hypothetical protein